MRVYNHQDLRVESSRVGREIAAPTVIVVVVVRGYAAAFRYVSGGWLVTAFGEEESGIDISCSF